METSPLLLEFSKSKAGFERNRPLKEKEIENEHEKKHVGQFKETEMHLGFAPEPESIKPVETLLMTRAPVFHFSCSRGSMAISWFHQRLVSSYCRPTGCDEATLKVSP